MKERNHQEEHNAGVLFRGAEQNGKEKEFLFPDLRPVIDKLDRLEDEVFFFLGRWRSGSIFSYEKKEESRKTKKEGGGGRERQGCNFNFHSRNRASKLSPKTLE